MKRSDRIILILYIIIGIVLVITGWTIQIDYYSSMIFAMGVGLICSSVWQFIRFYHNTRPENIEAYQEKLRQQTINLKDERKVQLRNRAGYITWTATMAICLIASFIAAVLRAGAAIGGGQGTVLCPILTGHRTVSCPIIWSLHIH